MELAVPNGELLRGRGNPTFPTGIRHDPAALESVVQSNRAVFQAERTPGHQTGPAQLMGTHRTPVLALVGNAGTVVRLPVGCVVGVPPGDQKAIQTDFADLF